MSIVCDFSRDKKWNKNLMSAFPKNKGETYYLSTVNISPRCYDNGTLLNNEYPNTFVLS